MLFMACFVLADIRKLLIKTMVQLLVKLADDGSNVAEWTIVELQGDLECKNQDDPLNGKFIGDLHFTKKGQPIFIIGHHVLFGKVIQLDKPLVVLLKTVQSQAADVSMETNIPDMSVAVDDLGEKSGNSSTDTYYAVKAVVRQKIIFRTRPKPIITSVPKKV